MCGHLKNIFHIVIIYIMGVFSFDREKMECFDNRILRKNGFHLPCFDCKSLKRCNILVDENLFANDGPHIECKSCETILTDARYDTYKDYKFIYKKILQEIDERLTKILNRYNEYSIDDAIYNLTCTKKNFICNILKILYYNHINLYGETMKKINIDYFLQKLFDFLEIDLEFHNVPKIFDKYFDDIIEYSYETIYELFDETFLN